VCITTSLDYAAMLAVALQEARAGLAEGGIPVGAAIFDASGKLVGAVQLLSELGFDFLGHSNDREHFSVTQGLSDK
jgi:tRNA(Arg) A34 adenosine deaminase TadA